MLELRNIKKDYPAGNGVVHALKGIDLSFRKSEFVSILGPSGCGKTTMLNIIGGLDSYTEGDLIINGTSTKQYKDRDWDSYRNHSIGFVFQSYNLIPHQTVLQNVEIALTLSGVSKSERKARAKKALEEVGLGDQLNKKPGEMSGGQMQRVAIARALVNNPDIILADEPTGALDTQTSIQIMEILKKISEDRLIIMVTHNPELAEQYSSRIIKMLDGKITDDSKPLTAQEISDLETAAKAEAATKKKIKKPSMSLPTAFMLSLKNLFTKKGRTTLTSFAGSIGIIGIALILAVSQGTTNYIDDVQESALSSYPLTLEASTVELTSLIEAFTGVESGKIKHDNDAVYKKDAIYDMVDAMNRIEQSENDLKSFNEYLKSELSKKDSELSTAINGVQYSYDLDLQIYTKNVDGKIIKSDINEIISSLMLKYIGIDMEAMSSMQEMSPMGTASNASSGLWQELLPAKDGKPVNDLLKEQYDVIYGSWPNEYDEIVLVVDENNEIDDMTLYALGLLSEKEIDNMANAAINGTELNQKELKKWSYEEICSMEYKTLFNSRCYYQDPNTGLFTDLRETELGLQSLYDSIGTSSKDAVGIPLKITGIIRPSEDADTTMLRGSICYTSDLTEYIIKNAADAPVVKAQLENPNIDVFTGLPFESSTGTLDDETKAQEFKEYIAEMSNEEKIMIFSQICILNELSAKIDSLTSEEISNAINNLNPGSYDMSALGNMSEIFKDIPEEAVAKILPLITDEHINTLVTLFSQDNYYKQIFESMNPESLKVIIANLIYLEQYNIITQAGTSSLMKDPMQLLADFNLLLETATPDVLAALYDSLIQFSESTYEDNLVTMGQIDLSMPSTINIYATSFENKDIITAAIEDYNKGVDELKKIKYTDYLGIMMSSITIIIDAITYVLIAFVAISLVVSSIMIGVITLISVQERTKEIGILRAIGASKRDVSSMFNAETMIVGFSAGLLGVLVTYLLCIPINLILQAVTEISNLNATLPIGGAIILVVISVLLTLIAGLIPSRSAAKKDPVVALRSE